MKFIIPLLFLILTTSVNASDFETVKNQAIGRDSQAQYQLGQMYQRGEGVKQDAAQAFYWIEQAAENGNPQAQAEVAEAYVTGNGTPPDNEQAVYWLTLLATNGHTSAQTRLGQLFEQKSPQLSPQSLALIWYRVAATKDPEAELFYSQLLEKQFNQQRAKQISQIKLLDKLLVTPENTPAEEKITPPAPARQNSGELISNGLIWGSLLTLFLIIVMVLKQLVLKKQKIYQQNTDIQSKKLSEQQLTIKKQKQQLAALFQEVKKLQHQIQSGKKAGGTATPPSSQKLELACALFGYQPNQIPEMKQIKLRYKQLSKIYHPDLKGSDDEMKRLNQSLKVILAHLKQ
ncbi:J domain-containing protein [Vibrio quintilis]|uniref:Localization factor PodJL n=1 Tax=Vibrio quintilis TaxID=1117707 RepID=A0A1M7YUV7_9VIBR|nr:J domain-containing protein [Vibrio quintilis]SHO56358.1 Localization factor PodJL [Vibrio quintilis]